MTASPSVGGEVDAWCTKCRMNLAHVIVAMVGSRIARVRCNTCMGEHAYRAPPGTTEARKSTRTSSASKATSAPKKVVLGFEDQLRERDLSTARDYSPRVTFEVDQILRHPTFGHGIVSAVRSDKIDVTFKTQQKTLVHGRGTPVSAEPDGK